MSISFLTAPAWGSHKALHIFSDHIRLDIDGTSRGLEPHGGKLRRVGNDAHLKGCPLQPVDGETHPVHRHGPLVYHVPGKRLGHRNGHDQGISQDRFSRLIAPTPSTWPGHQMSVDAVREPQGPLQVDPLPDLGVPRTEIAQSFQGKHPPQSDSPRG